MTPDDLLDSLARPGTVLLDGSRPDADSGHAGAWLFRRPEAEVVARTLADVGPALEALDGALARGRHVAGLLAYEAGFALVPGLAPETALEPRVPLVAFGVFGPPEAVPADVLEAALARTPLGALRATFGVSRAEARRRIASARAHIHAGDVYQLNLTAPFEIETAAPPVALYAALRARQAVPYGAVVTLPGASVLSVSPELFVRVDDRRLTARPMKGTAPRGATPAADDALADALTSRGKDRAENLMIVDLLRNDLAQVAETGSVAVPALFAAERYATLTQMTSTVTARLRPGAGLADVLRATFPCGSVTGAPKRRAMELIRHIEGGPRGAYCGAVGVAAPGDAGGLGAAVFSVAIRTAVVGADGRGRYDVGSGIVWDSEADAEIDEWLLKARVLTDLAAAGWTP